MALQKGGNKNVTLTQSHVEQSVEVVMKDLVSEKSPCLGTQLVPVKKTSQSRVTNKIYIYFF